MGRMNKKQEKTVPLSDYQTYIFIDVSNIRLACRKTLGWELDFYRLIAYLKNKYVNLKDVRYYEGLAVDDLEKRRELRRLQRAGYTICSLTRKTYEEPAVYRKVRCRKCGHSWEAKVMKQATKMKSNVDVYLSADMLTLGLLSQKSIHLILVSCDGDYAEAIKNLLNVSLNIKVSVLATPPAKELKKNTLSVRLKRLYREVPLHKYDLSNIDTIKAFVAKK